MEVRNISLNNKIIISEEKLYKWIDKKFYLKLLNEEKYSELTRIISNVFYNKTKVNKRILLNSLKKLNSINKNSVDKDDEVILDSKKYLWTKNGWIDTNYLKPPLAIINKLNDIYTKRIEEKDNKINNIYELIKIAKLAKKEDQLDRAIKIAKRILNIDSNNEYAVSLLSSTLRIKGEPELSIKETEKYKNSDHSHLLITRAAAFADLEEWEKAKITLFKVHNIEIEEKGYYFSVRNRIKKNRPELI